MKKRGHRLKEYSMEIWMTYLISLDTAYLAVYLCRINNYYFHFEAILIQKSCKTVLKEQPHEIFDPCFDPWQLCLGQ